MAGYLLSFSPSNVWRDIMVKSWLLKYSLNCWNTIYPAKKKHVKEKKNVNTCGITLTLPRINISMLNYPCTIKLSYGSLHIKILIFQTTYTSIRYSNCTKIDKSYFHKYSSVILYIQDTFQIQCRKLFERPTNYNL